MCGNVELNTSQRAEAAISKTHSSTLHFHTNHNFSINTCYIYRQFVFEWKKMETYWVSAHIMNRIVTGKTVVYSSG